MSTNGRERFSDIIKGDKPVLFDYYADWCGACKMMATVIQEFTQEMGDKVRVLKVDVDRNPDAARAYNIQGVPTMILFRNGKKLWREAGVVPKHVLQQVVTPHLER